MSGRIYLIQSDDSLQALEERPYQNEDLLQTLLEKYPELLAGEQITPPPPRRWLLISREVSVPDEERGGQNMYLDHLFLDQDGIPTLVEVKRSSDVRIRREVVGQMLDYAANAVVYWPLEEVRTRFELACESRQEDPAAVIATHIQTGIDDGEAVELFWNQVKTNLQAGRIRMVFVADSIPPQLRRVVEFLNEQMDPAEVLAVELRQFVGQGIKTIVPRIIGQTAEAGKKKGSTQRETRQWDEISFFAELAQQGDIAVTVARRILVWAREHNTHVYWGKGTVTGSFAPTYVHHEIKHPLFAVWTRGRLESYFSMLKNRRPFKDDKKRQEIVDRFNEIDGISLPPDALNRQPSLALTTLADEQRLSRLLAVFEWVIAEIERREHNTNLGNAEFPG
jgi:hypothetical protein